MSEQPDALTLWNMIPWLGSYGVMLFYISLILLIAIPLSFIIFKSQRHLMVWITEQSIKFNILAGLCLLLWGILHAGDCMDNVDPLENFLINAHKAVSGLFPIALITTALFIAKFVMELLLKLNKKTEPGSPLDSK